MMIPKPIKETFRVVGWTALGLGVCTGVSLGLNEGIKVCHKAGVAVAGHAQNMIAPSRP